MIQSMTGFGRSEGNCLNMTFRAEVRSVNHRYSDVSIRIPDDLSRLEHKMRSSIAGKLSRGKFDVYISRHEVPERGNKRGLNVSAVRKYQAILDDLATYFNTGFILRREIGLADLIHLEEKMMAPLKDKDYSKIDKTLMKIFNDALNELVKMRLKEGKILHNDLKKRIKRLSNLVKRIEQYEPKVIHHIKERYFSRIKELSEVPELDKDRLHQELAIMIERTEVTEEIVRIKSHITQLGDKLDKGGVIGRSLDFLLQEVNREINTIASKTSDIRISNIAIEMKTEVERIREQVQNIE